MWGSLSTTGNWNERYSCPEIGQPFHQELRQSSVSLLLFSLPLCRTAFSSRQQWALAERGPSLEMASCPALVYLVVDWCCSLLSASLGCDGPSHVYGSPTPESILGRPCMPELSMLFSCCPFHGSWMGPCICRGKVGWEKTGFLPFSSPLPPVLPTSAFNHYRDQENE